MKIKAVIFDKDGTLLDFEACWLPIAISATKIVLSHYNSLELTTEVYKNLGILPDGTIDIDGPLCKGYYYEIGKAYVDVLDAHSVQYNLEEFISRLTDAYHVVPENSKTVPIYENTRELLLALRDKGIKTAVITSDDEIGAKRTLTLLGICDLFDVILFNDRKSPQKPDPHYMRVFTEKTGIPPSEVLVVGDTYADMRFAENTGAHSLGVARSEYNRKKLENIADRVAHDISSVERIIDLIG